jgi:hypothetical protein
VKREVDTIGFLVGLAVLTTGVALYSVRLALVVAGLVICALSASLALARAQKARRRDS